MVQLRSVAETFGEVNVRKNDDGTLSVEASILLDIHEEGARVGLALDGSASMHDYYGRQSRVQMQNIVEPEARRLAICLANTSCAHECEVLYWACGVGGSEIEALGCFNIDQLKVLEIKGPTKDTGAFTNLLPPVQHLAEKFRDAPWAMGVIVTDGKINDCNAVKDYSVKLGEEMVNGTRKFLKLVLIGVGDDIDEKYMAELDDMFKDSGMKMYGTDVDVDLWDHKFAADLKDITRIFAEVVKPSRVIAKSGEIFDNDGNSKQKYDDTHGGVPQVLRFTLPATATGFRLLTRDPQIDVYQDIREVL